MMSKLTKEECIKSLDMDKRYKYLEYFAEYLEYKRLNKIISKTKKQENILYYNFLDSKYPLIEESNDIIKFLELANDDMTVLEIKNFHNQSNGYIVDIRDYSDSYYYDYFFLLKVDGIEYIYSNFYCDGYECYRLTQEPHNSLDERLYTTGVVSTLQSKEEYLTLMFNEWANDGCIAPEFFIVIIEDIKEMFEILKIYDAEEVVKQDSYVLDIYEYTVKINGENKIIEIQDHKKNKEEKTKDEI